MRRRKSTNGNTMDSNLDLLLVADSLHGLLSSPGTNELGIRPVVFWGWHPSAVAIASIVPKYYINAEIEVEIWPLGTVLLGLSETEIWVADYN